MTSHDSTSRKTLYQRLLNWANQPGSEKQFFLRKLHSVIRILIISAREFNKNELNIRASALTYTILLSLVPMLAMSAAIVKGLGGGQQLRTVAYSYIDTLEQTSPLHTGELGEAGNTQKSAGAGKELQADEATEGASITNHLRSAADQLFDYVDHTDFATLGSFGVLGILLSALLVFGNIEFSMNTIWHVSSGRSVLRKVTDYLTFMILMPLSINFGFAANTILKNDTLLNKLIGILPAVWVQTTLLFFIPLFCICLTFFLIYIFFPHTKVQLLPAFIGATCAGVLWFVTQNIYIGLQVGVSRYNAIYGSFATLPLFLVWIFLGWVFILGGAQLAFACQKHNDYQLIKENHSPLQQLSAAIDILNLTFSSYATQKPLLKQDIPNLCTKYPAELLFNSLKKLKDSKLIETSKSGRLLPGAPADKLIYRQIFTAILGNSFPSTEGGKTVAKFIEYINPLLNKNLSAEEEHGS